MKNKIENPEGGDHLNKREKKALRKLELIKDEINQDTLKQSNIMTNLDKLDGACDYFQVLERENEDNQEQSNSLSSSQTIALLNVIPKGYPQKHMYKQPKVCPDKFQIEVDNQQFKGDKYKYNEQQLKVYSNQRKRANSEEYETLTKEKEQPKHKLQRRDHGEIPIGLNQEPQQKFVSDQLETKYQQEELDDYLEFCSFVMRSAPVQGNYCGIWLRGSHMYKENAFKLLNRYKYNFDVAKFHILYPQLMADPEKNSQIVQISITNPKDFAKEVANAVIDLQGCKKQEIDEIINKFRVDLENRISDEQLKFHLTALEKIRVPTPSDIEDKIKKSIEFSKEIKKKCNIQPGSLKSAMNIPTEKKLKMSELIDLHEQQKTYCYITQEMIILQQQLEKAKQWEQRVHNLRSMESVHFKTIDQIYQDGKNIPVNFQDMMLEIVERKNNAEDLNNRIQDAIIVKKTRGRIGDSKKSGKKQQESSIVETQPDKELVLRSLLQEAKSLQLQSDAISKLQIKLNDIDKWKQEVNLIFQNGECEEAINYKRYLAHYKSLLSRSSVFHIELQLMKDLQRKCCFIDWRDKIEEMSDKLKNKERVTLDHLSQLLDEGIEKSFLCKVDQLYQKGEEPRSLFQNFDNLQKILDMFQEAKDFNQQLKQALQCICCDKSSFSGDSDLESKEEDYNTLEKLCLLETRKSEIQIEVENFKEFTNKLQEVRKAEEDCKSILLQQTNINSGYLNIDSQETLNKLLGARKVFQNQNVSSTSFEKFYLMILPFILWMNKATRLIKQYSRAIGFKSSQLNLYEIIEDCELTTMNNPYDKETNYESLMALSQDMLENPQLSNFNTFEEGLLISQIIEKTKALKTEFQQQQQNKRSENFDIVKYFKLLEQIQNSGLPEQADVIEEARVEFKREKWIKKYNDVQMGKRQSVGQLQIQNENSSSSNTGFPQASGHVKIKTIDVLVKEFQTSKELNTDEECCDLITNLESQQKSCQEWLDNLQECFDSQGHFSPPGGQTKIDELLEQGKNLDLKLKEYVDLQVHQQQTSEWQQTTVQIFNNSKSIPLDQLKKHIKDTIDITENGNIELVELLEALKETTTIWKIFANTIRNIRNIENIASIVSAFQETQCLPTAPQQSQDLYCICRQPEKPENSSFMLCCDFCDMWYHYTCVGLPKDLNLNKIKYRCIGCAIREGKVVVSETGTVIGNITSQETELKKHQSQPSPSTQDADLLAIQEDPHQQEIETLLLDLFVIKTRVSEEQFNFVIDEGQNKIPLKLEEMSHLMFLKNSIEQWKSQVQIELENGIDSKTLINNFKLINVQASTETQILDIQNKEKHHDEQLLKLIIQAQSFPVILQDEIKLIQLLRVRDWFRLCLQTFYTYVLKGSALKTNKQSKTKFKKEVKKLVLTGEQMLYYCKTSLQTEIQQILEILQNMPKMKTNNFDAFEKVEKKESKQLAGSQQDTNMFVSIPFEQMINKPDESSFIVPPSQKETVVPQVIMNDVNQINIPKFYPPMPQQNPQSLMSYNLLQMGMNTYQSENVMNQQFHQHNQFGQVQANSLNVMQNPCLKVSIPSQKLPQTNITQNIILHQSESQNIEELKKICEQIQGKMNEDGENLENTEWLTKTVEYTNQILEFGGEKTDDKLTIQFIEEGKSILKNVTFNK